MLTGLKRNPIDKFYTKPHVVSYCVQKFKDIVGLSRNDLIIEPAAGNGAFIKDLQSLNVSCCFLDIEPEHKEIIKQDYLTFEPQNFENQIHVIGNPPFGRQSTMAIKFIKHSSFARTISFILPKSFKKESMRRHFPTNFHLLFEEDLEIDSFTVNNQTYNVPTVFQIWWRQNTPRAIVASLRPDGYTFVKQPTYDEDNIVAFRRVGVYAGTIYTTKLSEKSIQSHYFIKFDRYVNPNLFSQITCADVSGNTTGPKSISKQELIERLNPLMQNIQK